MSRQPRVRIACTCALLALVAPLVACSSGSDAPGDALDAGPIGDDGVATDAPPIDGGGGDDAALDAVADARSEVDGARPDGGVDAAGACIAGPMGPTGVLSAQSIDVKGTKRTYVLSIPSGADATHPLPVVFAFHGDGGNGAGLRSYLALEAPAKGGAIFVYPDGIDRSGAWWDIETAAASNPDVQLFDALHAFVAAHYCIDARRIYVTGFSRGGYFTNHLACLRGDVLRAIAPQSGGGPYGGTYNGDGQLVCPTPSVPAMMIHGNADTTVPNDPSLTVPNGGWQSYRHWSYWNHPAPRSGYDYASDPIAPSPCFAAKGMPADHPVIGCFIDGLGHAKWSGEADAVWGFFAGLK